MPKTRRRRKRKIKRRKKTTPPVRAAKPQRRKMSRTSRLMNDLTRFFSISKGSKSISRKGQNAESPRSGSLTWKGKPGSAKYCSSPEPNQFNSQFNSIIQ